MTDKKVYMIFQFKDSLYGMEIPPSTEIHELPALKSAANVSAPIAGFLNFHGKIITVLDLYQFLGSTEPRKYTITDQLFIIKKENETFGVIVPSLVGIQILSPPEPPLQTTKWNDNIIFVVDSKKIYEKIKAVSEVSEASHLFEIDLKDKAIFEKRAELLMHPLETERTKELEAYVVVKIGHDQYALDAKKTIEVCSLGAFTAIPKAPTYVVGLMNLRGTSLPLVNIAKYLHARDEEDSIKDQVVVAAFKGASFGILVNSVLDLIYLRNDEKVEAPSKDPWIKQMSSYNGEVLAIVDLDELLHVFEPTVTQVNI